MGMNSYELAGQGQFYIADRQIRELVCWFSSPYSCNIENVLIALAVLQISSSPLPTLRLICLLEKVMYKTIL